MRVARMLGEMMSQPVGQRGTGFADHRGLVSGHNRQSLSEIPDQPGFSLADCFVGAIAIACGKPRPNRGVKSWPQRSVNSTLVSSMRPSRRARMKMLCASRKIDQCLGQSARFDEEYRLDLPVRGSGRSARNACVGSGSLLYSRRVPRPACLGAGGLALLMRHRARSAGTPCSLSRSSAPSKSASALTNNPCCMSAIAWPAMHRA